MDLLGRYYTSNLFSNLLVSNITVENPSVILELGAGGGALLDAAVKRWINASFFATDIDGESIANIKSKLPFVNLFHDNSLSLQISRKIRHLTGGADVAICNPPYLRLKDMKQYNELLVAAKLPLCKDLNFITSDIIFLAQNLTLLKTNGQLGIILPDSLITGREFIAFRQTLLENHSVSKIIQLPENIFPKTEALTHIVFIEKDTQTTDYIEILKAQRDGSCIDKVSVPSSLLVERMDFKYHAHIRSTATIAQKIATLGDFSPEIRRGSLEQKELRQLGISQVHTTTLKHANKEIVFKRRLGKKYSEKYVVAQPGDILLARVGRGCMGKVSMVKEGEAVLSDCLYRIRVAGGVEGKVFSALCSPQGQEWIKALSHGVCAKVLSKSDLLKFPIFEE
jgi:type I restriction enzyme M protein